MSIWKSITNWFKETWENFAKAKVVDMVADIGGTPEQVEATRDLILQAEEKYQSLPKSGAQKEEWVRQGLSAMFDAVAPYLVNALIGVVFGYLKRLGKV